jgi:hypothetical protein
MGFSERQINRNVLKNFKILAQQIFVGGKAPHIPLLLWYNPPSLYNDLAMPSSPFLPHPFSHGKG